MNNQCSGPVAPACWVRNFEHVIELANRSRYGLGTPVYATNLDESMRAFNKLQTGMVWVNAPLLDNDASPCKKSGSGRQVGAEGLNSFGHSKLVMSDSAAQSRDICWYPYAESEAFSGERRG